MFRSFLDSQVEWTATMDFTETNQLQLDKIPPSSSGLVLLVTPPSTDVQWFVWQDQETRNVFSHHDATPTSTTLGDDCPEQDDDMVAWLPSYAPRLTLWYVNNVTTTATIYGCTNGTNVTQIGEILTTNVVANTTNTSSVP